MKIENLPLPNLEGAESRRSEAVRKGASAEESRLADQTQDRVELFRVTEVEETVKAAQEAPDIRISVVEVARQMLAEGKLGRDSSQLADRLIDYLLSWDRYTNPDRLPER